MKKILCFLLAIAVIVTSKPAYADGLIVPPYDYEVTQASQTAFISYQDGYEDLVIKTRFSGNAKDFGWVIPVPARPEVERGKKELFSELGRLTEPRKNIIDWLKGVEPRYYALKEAGMGAAEVQKAPVEVLETGRVGILDYAVLESTDPTALRKWLDSNGYHLPGEVNRSLQVLQEYIDDGWFFVAAKIDASFIEKVKEPTEESAIAPDYYPYYENIEITPIHLRFKVAAPVYPMKITSLSNYSGDVLLYVFTDSRVWIPNYQKSEAEYPRPLRTTARNLEARSYFEVKFASPLENDSLIPYLPNLKSGYITKLYAGYIPFESMQEDIRFEKSLVRGNVGTGEMKPLDWVKLPIFLVVYLPYRLVTSTFLDTIGIFGASFYGSNPILGAIFLIGLLGIFGVVWTYLLYVALRKSLRRRTRMLLHLIQLPGVWLAANSLSLAFVLPYKVVNTLLGVLPEVVGLNLFLANNFGAVFFAVVLYYLMFRPQKTPRTQGR